MNMHISLVAGRSCSTGASWCTSGDHNPEMGALDDGYPSQARLGGPGALPGLTGALCRRRLVGGQGPGSGLFPTFLINFRYKAYSLAHMRTPTSVPLSVGEGIFLVAIH